MLNLSQNPPLSLYIHYPWCVKKCPYCDFNSHQQSDVQLEKQYVQALVADLSHELPGIWGRSIHSIFIGGGTPSLISVEQLDDLISHLRALLNFSPAIEFTLEANPGTVDYVKFAEFRQLGINRLSLGVQSYHDETLEKLGRIHSAKEAILAIESAYKAGFENINQDIMFALPGQDLKHAKADLQQAIELQTPHLSYYQLTLEPNTLFALHPPRLPDDDLSYTIQTQGHELLQQQGYEQYEVSAWSKPNHQCQHNLNYWQFGDYLGIGAGAHGKITHRDKQAIIRNWKLKQPEQYINGEKRQFMGEQRSLIEADLIFEFMLNALRLTQGVPRELFFQTTGVPIIKMQALLQQASEKGLLTAESQRICATDLGFQYLNELQELFLV